jgi:hypothetical protein
LEDVVEGEVALRTHVEGGQRGVVGLGVAVAGEVEPVNDGRRLMQLQRGRDGAFPELLDDPRLGVDEGDGVIGFLRRVDVEAQGMVIQIGHLTLRLPREVVESIVVHKAWIGTEVEILGTAKFVGEEVELGVGDEVKLLDPLKSVLQRIPKPCARRPRVRSCAFPQVWASRVA